MKDDQAAQNDNERLRGFAQLLYSALFFNIFTRDELCEVVKEERLIKWKKFGKAQRIFGQGLVDQHFYIVIQGKVDIRKSAIGEREKSVGAMSKGEVFGEMVVCEPGQPRRASAYAPPDANVIVCEVDATLLSTVSDSIRAKLYKKFLDLVVERFRLDDRSFGYYQQIIEYAREADLIGQDEYFQYALNSAATERNRLTQYVKFTDFLTAKKIPPEISCRVLKELLDRAVKELDRSFCSV
ncbi:MAG: cyclic nucleotide-binding domain-containing protein [Thermodesulfobacteriota bacterium]